MIEWTDTPGKSFPQAFEQFEIAKALPEYQALVNDLRELGERNRENFRRSGSGRNVAKAQEEALAITHSASLAIGSPSKAKGKGKGKGKANVAESLIGKPGTEIEKEAYAFATTLSDELVVSEYEALVSIGEGIFPQWAHETKQSEKPKSAVEFVQGVGETLAQLEVDGQIAEGTLEPIVAETLEKCGNGGLAQVWAIALRNKLAPPDEESGGEEVYDDVEVVPDEDALLAALDAYLGLKKKGELDAATRQRRAALLGPLGEADGAKKVRRALSAAVLESLPLKRGTKKVGKARLKTAIKKKKETWKEIKKAIRAVA
jgi:hypothetical protein